MKKKHNWMANFRLVKRPEYLYLGGELNNNKNRKTYSFNGHVRKSKDGHKSLNCGQRRAMAELPREV